jgi:hypothetical protein
MIIFYTRCVRENEADNSQVKVAINNNGKAANQAMATKVMMEIGKKQLNLSDEKLALENKHQ